MSNKKILIAFFLGILLIGIVSAVGEAGYCCEKTKIKTDGSGGKMCIFVNNATDCKTGTNPITNSPYKKAPTSCKSTSFCKTGTCINSREGICTTNTYQIDCQKDGGLWDEKDPNELPQCKLGCCLIGDQAAFVTQVRCKRLSSVYGIENNFMANIQTESECILNAQSDAKGACVYEKDYETSCKFITRKECLGMQKDTSYTKVEFHEGYLCTATGLGTNCAKTKKTTCVEHKDEIYFLDSCGNLANIYDSSKYDDENYWTYIKSAEESCGYEQSNANSKTCGNCDYLAGSICANYDSKIDSSKPAMGDKICRSLDCKDADFYKKYNRNPMHGETWCITNALSSVAGENLPGTEHFRVLCYNGEITYEPCEAFRNQICKEDVIQTQQNGKSIQYRIGDCVINKYQDCISQTNKAECEDAEARNCKWIDGPKPFGMVRNSKGTSLMKDEDGDKTYGACVPKYAPASQFWNNPDTTDDDDAYIAANQMCSYASYTCVAEYKKGITTGWDYELRGDVTCFNKDGTKIVQSWINDMEKICTSLGDCGVKKNFIGLIGYQNKSNIIKTGMKKA